MRGGERLSLGPRLLAVRPRDAPGPTLTPGFPVLHGSLRRMGKRVESRGRICAVTNSCKSQIHTVSSQISWISRTLEAQSHFNYGSGIWGLLTECHPVPICQEATLIISRLPPDAFRSVGAAWISIHRFLFSYLKISTQPWLRQNERSKKASLLSRVL